MDGPAPPPSEDVAMQPAPLSGPAVQPDNDEAGKVFLSVIYQNNRLGCAFYDTKSCVLRITEVHEDTNWSLLQLIKLEANPTQIITTSKADNAFLEALRQPLDEGSAALSVTVQVASDYAFDACKSRLLLLSPPDMPPGLSAQQRYSFLSRDIDFEATQMVRAAGALVAFLHKNRDTEREEDDSITIACIDNHCLEHSLHLDVGTLKALQVFKESALRSGVINKEGVSLFKLLNHTKSLPGTRLLKKWMLRPLRNIDLIEDRLAAVSAFVSPDSEALAMTLRSRLAKVKDITLVVCKIRKVSYNVADWKALFDSITNGAMVVRSLRSNEAQPAFFSKFSAVDIEQLEALLHTMNCVLDLDESKIEGRLVPKSGVDEQLDELKTTYAGLDSLLTDIGAEELRRYASLSTLKVVYLPQIGYEIALPVDEARGPQLSKPGTDLEYQFHTSKFVYFKNPRCRELDEYLGDIHYVIVELESAIIRELEQHVLQHSGLLLQLATLLAELDCILSLASAARLSKWTRPVITKEAELYIAGGRHPLQELCVSTFIPNNTSMSTVREGMLKLISGPNGSGKSVYVKQVGLIALMAHIGSYVPAESAKIGLVDRIFTRISSRETVSVSQSSFMLDLMQIAGMLRKASAHSLLLIDEFGKGTNSEDGLALLAAVVKHLLARQVACPRTLLTTHFTELVDYKLLSTEPNLELLTMDVLPGEEKDGVDLGRVFLYKLVPGWSTATYALTCAASSGVPPEILRRAEEITRCVRQGVEITRLENLSSVAMREYQLRVAKLFLAFDVERGDIRHFAQSLPEPAKEQ